MISCDTSFPLHVTQPVVGGNISIVHPEHLTSQESLVLALIPVKFRFFLESIVLA